MMIEFKNVSKQRNKLRLEHLNFTLMKGQLIVLAGKNGEGKSSLLKLIVGMISADSGEICIEGQSISEYKKTHAIAYMPDRYPFADNDNFVSISEWMGNVQPLFEKKGAWKRLQDLQGNGFGTREELSKGSEKISMYALARSIQSSILVLDEPTLGLDTKRKQLLLDDIQLFLMDAENTVIVSSNNIEDFEQICDQVVYIKDGSILFQCSPTDIRFRYKRWQGSEHNLPKEGVVNYWVGEYGTEALIDCEKSNIDGVEPISLERILYLLERRNHHGKIS